MDVLLLAYANKSTDPLPALQEESDKVYSLLTPRALQQHYIIHRDPYTTRQKIQEFLILYRDNIFMFSYSGHAGEAQLLLENEDARADGLARLLGQCPNLKLVLLNGCSTRGQVQQLLDCGVPLVIATSVPLDDQRAHDFAVAFFQSLSQGHTVEQAFELGVGAASLGAAVEEVHRGIAFRAEGSPASPVWGIYYKEDKAPAVRLPEKPQPAAAPDVPPNELLINTLLGALQGYSSHLKVLAMLEKSGEVVTLGSKRAAILNCLPAPVAEHLRKLVTPIKEANEGYDKYGEARLKQLGRAYRIVTEMMAFTLLSQLWEAKLEHESLVFPEETAASVRAFLRQPRDEAAAYNYIELISQARQAFEYSGNKGLINYFVPEMEMIKELPYADESFMAATFFMNTLRQRLRDKAVAASEAPMLCVRAEECLAEVFKHLGFMAQYVLASVASIDIQKYRHMPKPAFRHEIVRLIDVLGGLDQTGLVLERFTDNRSIFLVRENAAEGQFRELNLSPFIIDKNAFEPDAQETDVANIYFYHHYEAEKDSYFYYQAHNPDDPFLEVSKGRLDVVKAQMDAFYALFYNPVSPGQA